MRKIFRGFVMFFLLGSSLSVPNGIVRADNPKPSLQVIGKTPQRWTLLLPDDAMMPLSILYRTERISKIRSMNRRNLGQYRVPRNGPMEDCFSQPIAGKKIVSGPEIDRIFILRGDEAECFDAEGRAVPR